MHPKRARVDDIVFEFLPPARPSDEVVVICSGLPSSPSKSRLVHHFSKMGYWAIHLRYRGTWESGGTFLDHPPEQDVLELIEELPNGFTDIWSGNSFSVTPSHVHVVGSSFGGSVAMMASLDERVDRAIALSPVIDFTKETEAEPSAWLEQVIRDGYGGAFRFYHEDWLRLSRGDVLQPKRHLDRFDSKKLMIVHASDDVIVDVNEIEQAVEHIGCSSVRLRRGGHLSSYVFMRWLLGRKIRAFLAMSLS